ncbi:hypothetical protein MML48_3g00008106 [Holotrichia oblita]|uniref:Uncharacterized protein n=1 Tax=Holotrichia oblita TaxID=644536 RepID=A0ACB9TBQ9_HOLOL|nr:hypothetical protein MML48_3g00008106 [Holotrichia oblita]
MYSAETMTMTQRDEEELRILERKILRTILGPVKVAHDEYRIRMNHELKQEIGEDIVQRIKKQRIKWLGHVWRAGEEAHIRTLMTWRPSGLRRRGRPRSKWMEEVTRDLEEKGVRNWQRKAMDRRLWRKCWLWQTPSVFPSILVYKEMREPQQNRNKRVKGTLQRAIII